jgi:hypothetical protein
MLFLVDVSSPLSVDHGLGPSQVRSKPACLPDTLLNLLARWFLHGRQVVEGWSQAGVQDGSERECIQFLGAEACVQEILRRRLSLKLYLCGVLTVNGLFGFDLSQLSVDLIFSVLTLPHPT